MTAEERGGGFAQSNPLPHCMACSRRRLPTSTNSSQLTSHNVPEPAVGGIVHGCCDLQLRPAAAQSGTVRCGACAAVASLTSPG